MWFNHAKISNFLSPQLFRVMHEQLYEKRVTRMSFWIEFHEMNSVKAVNRSIIVSFEMRFAFKTKLLDKWEIDSECFEI